MIEGEKLFSKNLLSLHMYKPTKNKRASEINIKENGKKSLKFVTLIKNDKTLKRAPKNRDNFISQEFSLSTR